MCSNSAGLILFKYNYITDHLIFQMYVTVLVKSEMQSQLVSIILILKMVPFLKLTLLNAMSLTLVLTTA